MASFGSAVPRDAPELGPNFDWVARRIGHKLRELYGPPEAEPLPDAHVDLLLRLRKKERDMARRGEA